MTKNTRAFSCLAILLVLAGCQCSPKNHSNTLLFTTRLQGYVEPCGCTADPLGGIARLATLVGQYPGATFVDAGDLLFDPKQPSTCLDHDKLDLLLSTLKNLNLSGTVLAQTDDASLIQKSGVKILGLEGLAYFQPKPNLKVAIVQLPKEQLDKLEFLKDVDLIIWGQAPGEVLTPPFRLNTTGPYVLSAGYGGQYLGVVEFFNLDQKTKSPIELDKREYQRDYERDLIQKRLEALKARPMNDFLKTRIQMAEQELALLDKKKQPEPSGAFMKFTVIPIKKDIKPNAEVLRRLKVYEAKLPERLAACENSLECPKLKLGEASYVGTETCKTCHQAAYDFWKKAIVPVQAKTETGEVIKRLSGHAIAWKTLEEKHKDLDRNCIGCHSVGFMKPGGYCKARDVNFRKDVQCESCHGPGSLHAQTGDKTKIKREVPESTCRSCHHVPHIPSEQSFVYQDKLKVILGPGHGESLLLKLNK